MPERGAVSHRLVVLPLAGVVADRHHLRIARHAQMVEHVGNRLAPPAPEREVLVLGHVLVANDEQTMFVHGIGEALEHLRVETHGDVDADRLDPEARTVDRIASKACSPAPSPGSARPAVSPVTVHSCPRVPGSSRL